MTTLVTASPNTSAVIMSRERLRKLLAEAYQEGALDQMMKDLGA